MLQIFRLVGVLLLVGHLNAAHAELTGLIKSVPETAHLPLISAVQKVCGVDLLFVDLEVTAIEVSWPNGSNSEQILIKVQVSDAKDITGTFFLLNEDFHHTGTYQVTEGRCVNRNSQFE